MIRFACVVWLGLAAWSQTVPVSEPALSPDNKEVAFVSGSDIWTVPLAGGEARLLVSDSADESRPLYSPDGRHLAFVSNRDGSANLYVLDFATGQVHRLTFTDATEILDAWSRDGKFLYYTSSAGDIGNTLDIWRVPAAGGTPEKVSGDRYASEFHAAPSPDGKLLLFGARGFGAIQWWRMGRSHLDESELWILDEAASVKDRQVLGRGAKQLWPQWMPDARSFYFVSDRANGQQNLHLYTFGKGERAITNFRDGRVLFPNLAYDGKALVFERDFGIWRLDTATGKAEPISIRLRGAPSSASASTRVSIEGGYSGLNAAADGKKVAVTARGEVWAAAREGGDAFRVSRSADADGGAVWSPDSNQLAYISDRDGNRQIRIHDFAKGEARDITKGDHVFTEPAWSPDGKRIAYVADTREIRIQTLEGGVESVLHKGATSRSTAPVWSPDGEWIAAALPGVKGFTNLWVFKADGSAKHQVTWLPNMFGGDVAWGRDGISLFFVTGQRTEQIRIATVDLKNRAPEFREQSFRALFQKKPEDSKKPPKTEIDLDGIRERMRMLPLGMDAMEPVLSPDGKTLLFLGRLAGKSDLYTYSLDRNARTAPTPRQLTSNGTPKNSASWSSDGRAVLYLESGRVTSVDTMSRQSRPIQISAQLVERFDDTKRAVFRQAWMRMRDNFYDSNFHGADWNGTVRSRYRDAISGARTASEMRRILNLMVGELNASHLGVSPPPNGRTPAFARLGVDWVRGADGLPRITAILPRGPVALAGGAAVDDVIEAVNGDQLAASVNLDALLERQVDREVELTLRGGKKVRVRPIAVTAEKNLRYNHWVQERRDFVSKWSNGRLGYVHMFDMSDTSLERLGFDLDAETHGKEGVVVDVRNNNGGFVNAYALDILTRRNYLTMQPRGAEPSPARAMLGQRTIEKPTVLLTNQHSLSDAEDFSEGYRAMGLGKIVGEPTAGWIIYTSNQPLLDGSLIRVPSIRITTAAGENMELRPRPVDIPVDRPMGESYRGTDIQLETAVKTLLGSLTR